MSTSPPSSKKVAFKDEVEVATYDKMAKRGTKPSTYDANLNPPAEPRVLPVSTPKSGKPKAIGYKSFKTLVSRPEIKFAMFFASWVVLLLFLAIGVPPSTTSFLWYVLMASILFSELKLYGQWMSGGKRRLSVANLSNDLSAVGNFVGVYLRATMFPFCLLLVQVSSRWHGRN
ncbi:S-type anion channel SLAH2-like protein [Tanacetum coccineum]